MKEMSSYLLGVVTQSLWGGSPTQHPILNCAIECKEALLEIYMYVRYKCHDDVTLSYMQDALRRCHTFRNIFLLWWAGKKAKAEANALRTDLMKQRMVDEETNAEPWMPSKKQCKMNVWRDYIRHEIALSKELEVDFKFLKIYLMSHWVELICRYRTLQQYSAERHNQAHKTNLKDGWNASNHHFDYLPQVLSFQRPILCFKIREFNLQALAQGRENSTAPCKVLPSGANLAAPPDYPVIWEARIHGPPKPPWWKESWRYDQTHQSIIGQSVRSNAPHGNSQQHAGVY